MVCNSSNLFPFIQHEQEKNWDSWGRVEYILQRVEEIWTTNTLSPDIVIRERVGYILQLLSVKSQAI